MSAAGYYASRAALEHYLFFHYGEARDYLPFPGSPKRSMHYPARAVRALLDRSKLPARARALDLGCATGASSFELSRSCHEVLGVDLSRQFIRAANQLKRAGRIDVNVVIEGDRRGRVTLTTPAGTHPDRITFRHGDAMHLPRTMTGYDVVVMLNLIDRLPDPAACLTDVVDRINPGGQLIIASPYTWMEEYTPKRKWLGGRAGQSTREALEKLLSPSCKLLRTRQIPFILREHARKYQWSMAEGTCWQRR